MDGRGIRRTLGAGLMGVFLATAWGDGALRAHPRDSLPKVGLSLFFRNGEIAPVTLVGNRERFLQEIDITERIATTTDQGISPLLHSGSLAHLDWRGVHFVEEDWRTPGDGTFTRQRFYRGARWMEKPSTFTLTPKDRRGRPAGDTLTFVAGADDDWRANDDGFVRRYVARQITFGCKAIGDCSNATSFVAEGLAQSRQQLHPDTRAGGIDRDASELELVWSADPRTHRSVQLNHANDADFPFGYGLEPSLEILTPPTNGSFYLAGDRISFRLSFKDSNGRRLNPVGSLPSYGEFLRGESPAGLRYFDTSLDVTLYYAFKHREGNMLVSVSGPTDKLKAATRTVSLEDLFAPQVPIASVGTDGWTGLAQIIPSFPIILGGIQNPAIWETPISDVSTFTLPADALPGTYVAALKARRNWGGEALNRGISISLQVGSASATSFEPRTGHCNDCHSDRSALDIVNHGLGDRRTCFGCHTGIAFEPDNFLDLRVHFIHSRSERFPGDVNVCESCHLTPPTGPARGFPGVP
ncbi:MAG TPA: hypothetical protein VFK05_24360 [Polyangiaceae bacterium]|nr:hypothetical protein [Polyangiaceae bacterium]